MITEIKLAMEFNLLLDWIAEKINPFDYNILIPSTFSSTGIYWSKVKNLEALKNIYSEKKLNRVCFLFQQSVTTKDLKNLHLISDLSPNVIEIGGGRIENDNIELIRINLKNYNSNVRKIFEAIRRKVIKNTHGKGVYFKKIYFYKTIYFHNAMKKYRIWTDIVHKDIEVSLKTS